MTSGEWPFGQRYFTAPEDFDQYYRTGAQMPVQIAYYELNEQKGELKIDDPLWGEETLGHERGDEVFLELFKHPVFQRLAAIEQLTLPKPYATMPNSFDYTRWEHVWGSVVFVRKMLREAEATGRVFDPQEKIKMQLRTLLSDAGHTAFSHLGDWIKQSFGGAEDDHDLTLVEFLEKTGVCDVLRRFGIEPAEVILPEGSNDFVECDGPELCTDRVDYACREIIRTIDPSSRDLWRNAFYIDESMQLRMKDKHVADYFALCFGLMSTEHHVQPVHRLQLQLFAELVKDAVLQTTGGLDYRRVHPYDGLYTVDSDIMMAIRSVGVLNNDLHAVMLDIARSQRRIFATGRHEAIASFLSPYKPLMNGKRSPLTPAPDQEYLQPLKAEGWANEYSGVCPLNLEFFAVKSVKQFLNYNKSKYGYDVFLPTLKPRWVNPSYRDSRGELRHVGDDPLMKTLLDGLKDVQAQAYVARIHLAPAAVEKLRTNINAVQKRWDKAANKKRTEGSWQTVVDSLPVMGALALGASPHTIIHTGRR